MKADPHFTPCEAREGDEFFPNGIFEFNISRIIEDIEYGKLIVVKEALNVKEWAGRFFSINEEHMPNVKLGKPIILAEIAPERFNIIDGHHRLEKANREGVPTIEAYKLLAEQHIKYLTTENAYLSYVDYWNGKLFNMM